MFRKIKLLKSMKKGSEILGGVSFSAYLIQVSNNLTKKMANNRLNLLFIYSIMSVEAIISAVLPRAQVT